MDKVKRINGMLKKDVAIDIIASNIGADQKLIAEKIGVTPMTIRSWLSDPDFIEDVYVRYMEIAGFELPAVIQATIREAKQGNVHAARLVLEHFGKLENKLKIQVESNFEKFMKVDESTKDAEFFEVTDEQDETLNMLSDHVGQDIQLPERDESNNNLTKRTKKEKQRLKSRISAYNRTKQISTKRKQNERYAIRKRAEKVGLDLLPPGRHTKTVRDNWLKKLEELEKSDS